MKKILLNKKKILKIGLIGYNKSNGHFFSFPAIINGYSEDKFKKLNFPKILKYLEKENKNKFNIKNAKITNIWCQETNLSKRVSEACGIKIVNKDYQEMAYEVDAVIVARDDWKSHYKISKFFLSKNIKVFVDKPLTLSKKELIFFTKYLKSKLLMSCSALRFAKEYNALFGQYTYNEKKGVIPYEREIGKKHLIKHFSSLDKSVESYFKNINTHYAYEKFRSIRNAMHENNFDIKLLTNALDVYAEDKSYVDTINSIIDSNEFTQFDLRSYIFTSS